MSARQETIDDAILLFKIFQYKTFTLTDTYIFGFTKYDVNHINRFTGINHIQGYKFKKDPRDIPC